MEIGMLWFDNDPKVGLAEKIRRAASYYRQKYGITPNLCFLHPSMLSRNGLEAPPLRSPLFDLEIRTSKSVMPNYFWIGVNPNSGEG
ncbi:MAG: hypothetical protein NZ840_13625 [Anaerolineales bacterium]|nr:hypothetical protein [Anaerolineales bacterium]MDW8163075.1 hypothetical protein [Anaerolineales bacterium]